MAIGNFWLAISQRRDFGVCVFFGLPQANELVFARQRDFCLAIERHSKRFFFAVWRQKPGGFLWRVLELFLQLPQQKREFLLCHFEARLTSRRKVPLGVRLKPARRSEIRISPRASARGGARKTLRRGVWRVATWGVTAVGSAPDSPCRPVRTQMRRASQKFAQYIQSPSRSADSHGAKSWHPQWRAAIMAATSDARARRSPQQEFCQCAI